MPEPQGVASVDIVPVAVHPPSAVVAAGAGEVTDDAAECAVGEADETSQGGGSKVGVREIEGPDGVVAYSKSVAGSVTSLALSLDQTPSSSRSPFGVQFRSHKRRLVLRRDANGGNSHAGLKCPG